MLDFLASFFNLQKLERGNNMLLPDSVKVSTRDADVSSTGTRPATHTDFIRMYRFFTLRIWQNTDFTP